MTPPPKQTPPSTPAGICSSSSWCEVSACFLSWLSPCCNQSQFLRGTPVFLSSETLSVSISLPKQGGSKHLLPSVRVPASKNIGLGTMLRNQSSFLSEKPTIHPLAGPLVRLRLNKYHVSVPQNCPCTLMQSCDNYLICLDLLVGLQCLTARMEIKHIYVPFLAGRGQGDPLFVTIT